jgi:hypothetical protein
VYTVKRSDLENGLRKNCRTHKEGKSLNAIKSLNRGILYNNSLDTLPCLHVSGKTRLKRVKYDSKIRIVTANKKSIKFYAKTLFIWNDEFLIGERTAPTLRGINLYPVRLKDIEEIVVR